MKSSTKALAALAVVIVAGGIVLAVFMNMQSNNGNQPSNNSSENSQNSNQQQPVSEDAVATDTVDIKDFAFTPKTITVKKGTKVTWTNQDTVRHNVVGDKEDSGLDGPLLAKGETYEHTFDTVGSFGYYCAPHPYMKGTVVVTD